MIWWAIFTCTAVTFCGLVGGTFEAPTQQTTEKDCVWAAELALDLAAQNNYYRDKIKVRCELREGAKK